VTGWHQDIRYWSFERPELVSVWLALGDETPENGALSLIPGSHRIEFAPDHLDEALFFRADLPQNQALIASRVQVTLNAGDVLFFHCRTLHAAGANRTGATKFSLVFTYHALDNPPWPGTRSASQPSIPL
jgi:phytanoyl-CoA hydroxylase